MSAEGAYQGAPGAFSEDAARALLGASADLRPYPRLTDVFAALADGEARTAIVPIENTLAGSVPGAADLIAAHDVRIVAEHIVRITHSLIGVPGATLEGVRRVWSHPVALAQCEKWLRGRPGIRQMPAFDTAGAVAGVLRRGRKDEAAIAGRRAAEIYGGIVLQSGVQDAVENFTRFLLIERRAT